MSDRLMQALCCVCGNLRTCRRPRNYRRENYWLSGPIDRDWHRETGDLKCAECGRVTSHAILHPEQDSFRDHAERITNIALGMGDPVAPRVCEEIRMRYRQNDFPKNPLMNHRWWKSVENEARAAGQKRFPAMCGELVDMPEQVRENGRDITEMEAPTHLTDPKRADWDWLDVETGLTWTYYGECVNCLRVRNTWLLEQRRKNVAAQLIKIAAVIDEVDGNVIEQLAEMVAAAIPGGSQQ
ncbi:hypothetical protein ACAG25_16260 [Mycobacterium sp. pV006]|uniref:hypothetical protein n=1 Tax=Mycobacterium sp. pV006 TaxID=3238983 RepID=UPI00351AD971